MEDTDSLEKTCQCIDWFSEGEATVVEVGGVRVEVKFVGRKGRRGRIAITAPAGTVFHSIDEMPPESCSQDSLTR